MLRVLLLLTLVPLGGWLFGQLPWSGGTATLVLLAALLLTLTTRLADALRSLEIRGDGRQRWLLVASLALLLPGLLIRPDGGPGPLAALLHSGLLLLVAALLGQLTARGLRRPAELVPVCVVAAWADLCSIRKGPTAIAVEQIGTYYQTGRQGPPPLADGLLVKALLPGTPLPLPLFGVTDAFVVALLGAALARLELRPGPTLPLPGWRPRLHLAPAGLWLALLLAQIGECFVPGLVVICGLVLAWLLVREPASRRLTKRDWQLTLLFPLLISLGLALH